MATATAQVPMTTTPYSNTKQKWEFDVTNTATYYIGSMMAVNSSGNVVKATDSTGLTFTGILVGSSTGDHCLVNSTDTAGDKIADIDQPFKFTMKIASATKGDEGKPVYAKFENEVAYSTSNSLLVGWVAKVIVTTVGGTTGTMVEIIGAYTPQAIALVMASNTIAFAGGTGVNLITIPDNLANALSIEQGSNVYFQATTTDGSEVAKVLGPAATGVTNGGGAVQVTAGTGGTTSGTGGTVTIAAGAGGSGATVGTGGAVSVTGGASTGSGTGGAASLVGGAGGLVSTGGATAITGGAGGATSGNGGACQITGGAGVGTSGVGGLVRMTGGAGVGASAGGASSLIGGAGGLTGAGGAITITSGAGGGTSGAPGAINIAVGATTSGTGAAVTITSGSGGTGTDGGGVINLIPGSAQSTGIPGEVQINTAAGLFSANWQQFVAANVPVTGTSYPFFIADRAYRVKGARCVCSSTATVPTVDITKDTGTTAPGGGSSVLTGVMTFNTTANTIVVGTATATVATATLAAGDRLSTKWGGTIGSITGAMVSVLLVPC